MTHCANITCRRPLPERAPTDSGRPPTFCSRRCQLAARNPDHLHTLRVALPLDLVHRLDGVMEKLVKIFYTTSNGLRAEYRHAGQREVTRAGRRANL